MILEIHDSRFCDHSTDPVHIALGQLIEAVSDKLHDAKEIIFTATHPTLGLGFLLEVEFDDDYEPSIERRLRVECTMPEHVTFEYVRPGSPDHQVWNDRAAYHAFLPLNWFSGETLEAAAKVMFNDCY